MMSQSNPKNETKTGWTCPRKVSTKDQYYIELAEKISTRSKDPSTQCGAVAVSRKGKPLGFGYNGTPSIIDDNDIDWSRPNKYSYIIHSEINCIHHSKRSKLKGATLYVNNRPGPNCRLNIVDAGISRVVFVDRTITDIGSSLNQDSWQVTLDIARLANKKRKFTLERYVNGITEEIQL